MRKTATQRAPDEGLAEAREAPESRPASARSWSSEHPVNVRVTIPLPAVGRCYLTVLAGRERRSSDRRRQERERHPLLTSTNLIFLFVVGFVVGSSCWFVLRALVTWTLGPGHV